MFIAVASVSLLGALLGLALGFAAIKFAVDVDPVIAEIEALMPGSNCGQCGMAGCSAAARAIADGSAAVTCCPPGGKTLAIALAEKTGVTIDLSAVVDEGPKLAHISEEICIGCCRCLKVCPTDAIVGAAKQIHNVIREACTGCGNCVDLCPTEAVGMRPLPVTLQQWVWPKPTAADTPPLIAPATPPAIAVA